MSSADAIHDEILDVMLIRSSAVSKMIRHRTPYLLEFFSPAPPWIILSLLGPRADSSNPLVPIFLDVLVEFIPGFEIFATSCACCTTFTYHHAGWWVMEYLGLSCVAGSRPWVVRGILRWSLLASGSHYLWSLHVTTCTRIIWGVFCSSLLCLWLTFRRRS